VHSAFTPYPTSFPPTNPIPTHHPPRSPTTHLVNNAPQPPWHGVHPTTPPVIPPEDPPDSSPSDWLGAVAAVAWESSASGPDPMPFPARNKESSARLPEWAPGPRQWREWLPRGGIIGVGGGIGSSSSGVASGDRDFGCLVWDIEHQSSVTGGGGGGSGAVGGSGGGGASASAGAVGKPGSAAAPIKTPSYRFAHNCGVESLSWLSDGQILAVGCQKRNVQLYDLRVAGTNAPPISVFAHSDVVSGIAEDVFCPTKSTFATFGTNAGEPVKIWDSRKMHGTLGEIRVGASCSVSAISWSTARPGTLSVAIGDSIGSYDTRTPGSRALPVGVSYMNNGGENAFVQCLAPQPQLYSKRYGGRRSSTKLPLDSTTDADFEHVDTSSSAKRYSTNPFEFYPHRTLVVSSKGLIEAIPEYPVAPIAISKRDGRIAHGLGGMVCIGPTTEGPSAMEGDIRYSAEDVSAKMMRRARCLHAFRYSTNAGDNVRMLEQEKEELLAQHQHNLSHNIKSSRALSEFIGAFTNLNQLLSSWRWIALVEYVCLDQRGDDNNNGYNNDELPALPAKGLLDAGVMKLLKISSRGEQIEDSNALMESKIISETLKCDIFDSPMRRAAINACGWTKKYGVLRDLLEECESHGAFERSAALAIWHGDIGECVAALQRGAEEVRALVQDTSNHQSSHANHNLETYAETLNLIAMCVAGFNVTNCADGTMKSSPVWSNACESLLRRPDISETVKSPPSIGVPYLRAICTFLLNIGQVKGFNQTIYDDGLSLADRVAFACRFLSRTDLRAFLDTSLRKCLKTGNLEGLLITGLDKRGIGLLQSYVDRYSDVQSTALISCRVVLPTEWAAERRACTEWLDSYRMLLNNWQMWHSRAAFDVGRCDHLRRLKGGTFQSSGGRRGVSTKKQFQIENELSQSNFPPQLWARCNYCNSSLSLSKLRRQEGIANSWLSRQKPVLTCCPQCKKPLPRCSICLLSMGCLNPYMELQRERNQYPRGGMTMMGAGGMQGSMEDLSGLANIPFAEWFTWCMRCKHGGHAHHLVGWFTKHSTCAVSGCDCRCQFDGIEKLCRPGSSTNRD